MTRDEAMKWAEKIGPFDLKVLHEENYSGEHREWYETMRVPQGNPCVAKAAATVIQQAFAERDGEMREALEDIAVFANMRSEDDSKTFARVNRGALRTIRDKARQALAAKGDSRG